MKKPYKKEVENGWNYELGVSNDAADAYEFGYFPIGLITARDLKSAGWIETRKLAVWLAKKDFFPFEKHQTGRFLNETKFFSVEEMVEIWNKTSKKKKQLLKKEFATPEIKEIPEPIKVQGFFPIFKDRIHIDDKEFTGLLIGDWIHLDGGGKKKASGKSIRWGKVPTEEEILKNIENAKKNYKEVVVSYREI